MKKFINWILVLSFCGSTVFAQKKPPPPPPPAPLTYKAPEEKDLKEFVSADKTFQITFPGVPQISRQEIPNGIITSYRVYRHGANSIVNTIDYNFELENSREKIYETIRANLLKIPKSKIEAEKEININGTKGMEFEVLQDYQFQKIRIMIVGKRVYEVKNDVTNWHILSNYNSEKTVEFGIETERFFASFKSLKSPESIIVPIPKDFLGTATDTGYKNTFFNFSLNFPKSWSHLNTAEIDASKKVGLEMLKTEQEKINKAFEDSTKREVVVFMIIQKNNGLEKGAGLGIGVLKQPSSQVSAELVAIATKNFFLTNSNFELSKDIKKEHLNGTAFSTFIIKNKAIGENTQQKLYITIRNGYSVTFVLSYPNPESQKGLENIMKSLTFDITGKSDSSFK